MRDETKGKINDEQNQSLHKIKMIYTQLLMKAKTYGSSWEASVFIERGPAAELCDIGDSFRQKQHHMLWEMHRLSDAERLTFKVLSRTPNALQFSQFLQMRALKFGV